MPNILVVSDDGMPSGYGRISGSVMSRLVRRDWNLMAASISYDGLLTPVHEGQPMSYQVASLAGHNDWPEKVYLMSKALRPQVVLVIHDMTVARAVRESMIDWSRTAFCVITPVDGVPISPPWVRILREAEGTMSISHFGVAAHKSLGINSTLCQPCANLDLFRPAADGEQAAVRQRLGIDEDAFVLISVAMNQTRKAWDAMLRGFFAFAADKPNARYIVNTQDNSPAGWNIPEMCEVFGWDQRKLIFAQDCDARGVNSLRDRYIASDLHVVLAYREGFGVPHVEAMSCGLPTMALDYCSGREICGNGRGYLIPALDYTTVSLWGSALNRHPDEAEFTKALHRAHDDSAERAHIARTGMEYARSLSWDQTADAVDAMLRRAVVPAPVPLEQSVSVPAPLHNAAGHQAAQNVN